MSMAAVLLATRDYLRANLTQFSNRKTAIAVIPGLGPAPRDGEYSVAIDEVGIATRGYENLAEEYTIVIGVSRRIKMFAPDVQDAVYFKATYGLEQLERDIIRLVHGNHALRIAMDVQLGILTEQVALQSTGGIFQLPLFYSGRGATEYMNGTWGNSRPETESWLLRRMTFRGANRVQGMNTIR